MDSRASALSLHKLDTQVPHQSEKGHRDDATCYFSNLQHVPHLFFDLLGIFFLQVPDPFSKFALLCHLPLHKTLGVLCRTPLGLAAELDHAFFLSSLTSLAPKKWLPHVKVLDWKWWVYKDVTLAQLLLFVGVTAGDVLHM